MENTVYNLFAIVGNEIIDTVGIRSHSVSIPEEEMDDYLKIRCEEDLKSAEIYPTPENIRCYDMDNDVEQRGIHYTGYDMVKKNGELIALFEEAFKAVNAPMRPYVYYSLVMDDKIVRSHP